MSTAVPRTKLPKAAAAVVIVIMLAATSASIIFALSSYCSHSMFSMDTFKAERDQRLYLQPRQRYAVLSLGTDAKYAYWLPAVALAWKIRQRFTPIIFLVEDDAKTGWRNHSHTQLILDLLAEYEIRHVYFLHDDPLLPDNRVRLTQLSRLYASLLPFLNDHDFLLTTDVDLLPIAVGGGQYYESFVATLSNETLTSYELQQRQPILLYDLEEFQTTDDKFGLHFKEWALSNIGMSALRWRQILRLPSPIFPISISVEQHITKRVNEDIRSILSSTGNEWFWDQVLISFRLETARIAGSIVWDRDVLVKYRTNRDRVNRNDWPSSLSGAEIDSKFDSHLPRVPDTRGTYHEIFDISRWLLQYVLNSDGKGQEHVDRLSKFTLEFERSLQ